MPKESFEQKLEKAKELIDRLMNPEITLDESVKLYEEGLKSIQEAQKMLEEAKLKVENISKSSTGEES